MPVVEITRHNNIGLIALNHPPVNAMSTTLLHRLFDAVTELDNDRKIDVIALHGKGKVFCAGADITEFGNPMAPPLPPDVTRCIEDCTTPLVAVLHGTVLGGGLELGLAAHARVCTPDARMGLPEVNIGLIPGAGGCIRTPYLIGWDAAFELVTSGRPLKAQEALKMGLVDRVEEGDPATLAIRAAEDVLSGVLETKKTTQMNLKPAPEICKEWGDKVARHSPLLFAPKHAVKATSNALLPRNEALALEQTLFMDCLDNPQSAALVHAFYAERTVWKIPEVGATPRDLKTVGVIGGGTMGSGIATAMLLAGFRVLLVEQTVEATDRANAAIAKNLSGAVKRGKLNEEKQRDILTNALTTATSYNSLANADLIIEAVYEDMALKKDIFRKLDALAKPGAILASNTSGLDLNEISTATSRPGDVIGLHFFSPAHVMRLLEVVVGDKTSAEVVATGFALAKALRKTPVRAGVCDGFIGNRILFHYLNAADKLVLEGARPAEVDAAMESFGFAMGPYAVNDLAGIDISLATRSKSGQMPVSGLEQRMADAGYLGRKTGQGYYSYASKERTPNPKLPALISEEQTMQGISSRSISAEEIVDRILTAMILEAIRVLEEGIALRPVDIDAVYLFGYGFPRFQGGPMHYADTIGATVLLERTETYAKSDPEFWQAPDLLRKIAKGNSKFSDLNEIGPLNRK